MPTSPLGNTLLAIDIGAVNTRVAYFDVVDGLYRCIGMGHASTTANAPVRNTMIGVQLAIENLQAGIGKSLMDEDGHLVIPSHPDGLGVDNIVTSFSLGPAIKTLIVGLLPEVSLKSIEKLAQSTYSRVVDSLTLNDPRQPAEQVDAIVRLSPELVLIAGGVEGGSTNFIQKMLEIIALGSYLLPEERHPAVLYAGNVQLAEDVQSSLNNIASYVAISPNIRPSLDTEDLIPAQHDLANIVTLIRQKQMPELDEVRILSGGVFMPSSYAQGRMVRFLSSYFGSGRGVLSIDVGASALTMAASFGGDLHLNVYPQLGLGTALSEALNQTSLEDIARWLPLEIPPELVRDYLYQKALYPAATPVTPEELAIEQAIVRQNLLMGSRWMLQRLPAYLRPANGQLPSFEPILVSGSAVTNAANPAQKLLMLLDGLQPAGITTLALDHNNMLAMLGTAAQVNSILPVQALDTGILSYLATVISPVSNVPYGTPVVQARLIREDGTEITSEIAMGNLQVLPLESHQTARLQLRPFKRADVGLGPDRPGEVDVTGSAMGIVIDARGRPLRLPANPTQRRSLLQKWSVTLGG
jgi:hypothetical protein